MIFAEVGFGNEIIYLIIGILLAISVGIGLVGTLFVFVYHSLTKEKKSTKYYGLVFLISAVIGLTLSGIICGGML